jgi:hypothetical protein
VMNKPPSSWGSLSRYRIGETLADTFYEIHPRTPATAQAPARLFGNDARDFHYREVVGE